MGHSNQHPRNYPPLRFSSHQPKAPQATLVRIRDPLAGNSRHKDRTHPFNSTKGLLDHRLPARHRRCALRPSNPRLGPARRLRLSESLRRILCRYIYFQFYTQTKPPSSPRRGRGILLCHHIFQCLLFQRGLFRRTRCDMGLLQG